MEMREGRAKRRVTLLVALLVLLLLALGGTYAWQDYKQHKSNELGGMQGKYEARLVEDFKEVKDWKVEDGSVTKKISVTNLGKAGDGFGDVFVRIQLKEFMSIGDISYKETEKRYMIDEEGHYIVYPDVSAAQSAVAAGGEYEGHSTKELTDVVTGKSGWFIETRDGDDNGQMGKHVVTDIVYGKQEKVILSGPEKASDTNHHGTVTADADRIDKKSEECDYAIHSWKPGSELESRDFVDWQLNKGAVITLTDWLAGDRMPVAKWIVDDQSDSGWVFWGQTLRTDGDQTPDFLQSVSLITQPKGSFYYVIHTELEAVSFDELSEGLVNWGVIGDAHVANHGVDESGGGGGSTDPDGPGDPGDPDGPEIPDTKLPVKTPLKGFTPIYKEGDPKNSDAYYAIVNFNEPDDPEQNEIYHFGSVHLEDIITDGNYQNVTAKAVASKYFDYIAAGIDHHGKPSILYSYFPTNGEWMNALLGGLHSDFFVPVQVELSRDDGKSAIVTINMTFTDCQITLKSGKTLY